MKLVLVGNYDWDAAVAQVRESTRDWRPGEVERDMTPPDPRPLVAVERNDQFNRAHLYWMAAGVAEQDPRRYAAAVAGFVVGARRGSRLYWALTEPGIADSASFGHAGDDGSGTYLGYASCDPDRAQEVADLFRRTLDEACEGGLTEAEITGAKRKLTAAQVLHDETPMGRLMSVGMDWVYRRESLSVDEEVERVLAVTLEDANDALRQIPRDRAVLVGMGPFDRLE
jgi:predicted Zn-dependent peptidase